MGDDIENWVKIQIVNDSPRNVHNKTSQAHIYECQSSVSSGVVGYSHRSQQELPQHNKIQYLQLPDISEEDQDSGQIRIHQFASEHLLWNESTSTETVCSENGTVYIVANSCNLENPREELVTSTDIESTSIRSECTEEYLEDDSVIADDNLNNISSMPMETNTTRRRNSGVNNKSSNVEEASNSNKTSVISTITADELGENDVIIAKGTLWDLYKQCILDKHVVKKPDYRKSKPEVKSPKSRKSKSKRSEYQQLTKSRSPHKSYKRNASTYVPRTMSLRNNVKVEYGSPVHTVGSASHMEELNLQQIKLEHDNIQSTCMTELLQSQDNVQIELIVVESGSPSDITESVAIEDIPQVDLQNDSHILSLPGTSEEDKSHLDDMDSGNSPDVSASLSKLSDKAEDDEVITNNDKFLRFLKDELEKLTELKQIEIKKFMCCLLFDAQTKDCLQKRDDS